MKNSKRPLPRIGLSGTGFIARSFAHMVMKHAPDMRLHKVLTRRDPARLADFPTHGEVTNSIDALVESSDLVFECSGDVIHSTLVIERALAAGKPVVTMNSEFHVTTGSYFADRGLLTEAEGDQPGCLAALRENMLAMGFSPLVYGNMKGFLNHTPSPEDMAFWSSKQGISVEQTTSFTDGTKVQIEQAFIANHAGAGILRRGLEGPARDDTVDAARDLGRMAEAAGGPIADYLLSRTQMPGVFITARHDAEQVDALNYFKLGPGPYYVMFNPHHLCSIEAIKTVRRVLAGGGVLMNNSSSPAIGVCALAKRPLAAGQRIELAIGGFDVRGEAVTTALEPEHVPIGILNGAVLRHAVEPGQMIRFADVDIPDSRALEIVRAMAPAPVAA
jgi:predicted homoserine dehydrogenase-like protein